MAVTQTAASSSHSSIAIAQLVAASARGLRSKLRGSCSSRPFPDHMKRVFAGLKQPLGCALGACVLQH